jgi:GntR family transcriptional regulator of arabinose operon
VDGVKSSILSPNLDCYKELYRRKIPVIFYNNFYRNLRCPRVTINDIECAHQLIGRLMDAGHSNIAGIFVYDNYQSVEKFQGMAEAMRSRGLDLNDDYIKWCISDEAHNESYVRSIERFLKSIPKCTAIVCCNYIIYRLVMKTLQKMGKTVPEDYSLVCFDYSEETYRQEDVTCSVEQGFEMGRQLALRLMEMISTGECDDRNYTYVMKPILYDGHSIRKIKKVK